MIRQQQALPSEQSTPEVMSRWQPLREQSTPSMYTAKATFPEPNLSAADRAAAAACSASHSSAVSPFKRGAQPLTKASHGPQGRGSDQEDELGLHGDVGAVPPSFGWDNGSRNEPVGDEGPRFARPVPGSLLQNGGGGLRASGGMSEASPASVGSEPAKPSDYLDILAMLERVRLVGHS
jgi:hypothetical protein